MKVQVISEKAQKFNGETYYLSGFYYQRKGKRLHRAVWEFHKGEIPSGYDVHHVDHDRNNNQIENLQLLERREHHSNHMKEPERIAQSKKDILKAIEAAPEWHSTDEGKAWHSEHAIKYWENAPLNTYVCTFCGKEFQSRAVHRKKGNHFCGNNCRAAFRRRRLRNENKEH